MKKLIGVLCTFVLATSVYANTVELNPDRPDSYTVVHGDTLWGISTKFLRDPWRWPEIWHINQGVKNPHLIYPGDVLRLVWRDGKPTLIIDSREKPEKTTTVEGTPLEVSENPIIGGLKLHPRVRPMGATGAIPVVSLDAIGPFLSLTKVVKRSTLSGAAYVIGARDSRLMSGANEHIYVRGLMKKQNRNVSDFRIYRKGQIYRSGFLGRPVGYEAKYIGNARLIKRGKISKLLLLKTNREVLAGDKLIASSQDDTLQMNFMPHSPEQKINGEIIAVLDGVSRIGQYQVVAINLGKKHKMERGHVLTIEQKGATVRDRSRWAGLGLAKLPSEKAGLLMVFRTFDKVSYALVMSASTDIKVSDKVRNPT